MGGDPGSYTSTSLPYNDDQLDMILNGVYLTEDPDFKSGDYYGGVAYGHNDDGNMINDVLSDAPAYDAAHGIADLLEDMQIKNTDWSHNHRYPDGTVTHHAVEFGVLRAAVRSYAVGFVKGADYDAAEEGNTFVKGPWYAAAKKVKAGISDSLETPLINLMTSGASAFTPSSPFGIDILRGKVNVDKTGSTATSLPGSLVDLLNAKTLTYISGVETFDKFMELFSAPVGSEGFGKIYDAIFGTKYDFPSAPPSTTITAAPAFPQADAVPVAPTVAGPTLVTVTDALTAAKEAMFSELQTKYNLSVAELRSTLFGSRGMRPTNFDDVIAERAIGRDKAYTAYCAELDLGQAKMNADYADKHEDRIQAHDIAEGDFVLKRHQLVQDRDAQLLQYVDYQIRLNVEQASLIVKAALDWESAKATNAGIRVAVIKAMYDAVTAWMHAKGMMLSNAGPVAATIETAVNAELKDSQFSRGIYLDEERLRYELISSISNLYGLQAELEWKSIQQNIDGLRNVMSVFGVQTGVTDSPSKTERRQAAIGTGMSVISGIVGLASIL